MSKIKGKYFISNIDNEIHNVDDFPNKRIINWETWKEIEIHDVEGLAIDSCVIYDSLETLIKRINE